MVSCLCGAQGIGMGVAELLVARLLFALAMGLSGLRGLGWLHQSSGSSAMVVSAWGCQHWRCDRYGHWAGSGAGCGASGSWGWLVRLLGRSGGGGLRWVWAGVHSRQLTQSCGRILPPLRSRVWSLHSGFAGAP